MKTIYGWKSDSFTLLFGGLNAAVEPGAAAYVKAGHPLDNGAIFNKRIYLVDRILLPDTYLHELAHLTKLVPTDLYVADTATPYEATRQGLFYNYLENARDIGGALEVQLRPALKTALGIKGDGEFWSIYECCSFAKPFKTK